MFRLLIAAVLLVSCREKAEPYQRVEVVPPKAPREKPSLASSPAEVQTLLQDCRRGDGRACWRAGVESAVGRTVPLDKPGAIELFLRGCELGFGLACADHAGTTRADLALSLRSLERGAALDDPTSKYGLAIRLMHGTGVAEDKPRAVQLYRDACGKGLALACTNLGLALGRGDGAPADPSEARRLFDLGCRLEDPTGCNNLALSQEEPEARRLFQRACDLGGALGCVNLARRLKPSDPDQAAALFAKACQLGDAAACRSGQ